MNKIFSSIKLYFRWGILGGTLFFLLKAFKAHWQEVAAIQFTNAGWLILALAMMLTLLSLACCGWVWTWILEEFKQPVAHRWGVQVYLKTQIAKYLPGNVWHYYGRILAVTNAGGSFEAASLSVLLEPLLMAAAALVIALSGSLLSYITATVDPWIGWLQVLSLGVVLLGVHPQVLNRVIQLLSRFKRKATETDFVRIERYPLVPLLGELGFLGLRGIGFLFTLLPLIPVNPSQIPQLLSAFSFAWLLGLVVPGAPGGIGVFEATALALLNQDFPVGLLLSALALFRVVSILAEASGALLAILSEQR